jgi:hypothetical protein
VKLEIGLARLGAEQNSLGAARSQSISRDFKTFLRRARRGRACFRLVELDFKAVFFRDKLEIFEGRLAREVFERVGAASTAFSGRGEGSGALRTAP